MEWFETHYTILEEDYPYTATDEKCRYDASQGLFEISSVTTVNGDVASMKAAVTQQPLSIALDAGSRVFQSYTSGVIDSHSCGTQLNHAVVMVGYGTDTDSGLDYWLVRNSWGTTWGDNGFVRIAAVEGKGICGINGEVYYPTI